MKSKDRVTIYLPRIPGEESQTVEVGINGVFTLITRGETVDVLPEVAEVLRHGGLLP